MPSDNLEKYIREKIEAVQHTPPPGSTWNPEVAWLKLQPQPVRTRQKRNNWFSYTAAILVLALLAGLTRQYWLPSPIVSETMVATIPATETTTRPSESTKETVVEAQASTISPGIKAGAQQPEIAAERKIKQAVKSSSLQVAKTKAANSPAVIPASHPDAQPAVPQARPEAIPIAEATKLTEKPAQPLKITVVLGKNSTAKMLSNMANNSPAKSRKARLRLNIPSPASPGKSHYALIDSSYQPLRLQARIDL